MRGGGSLCVWMGTGPVTYQSYSKKIGLCWQIIIVSCWWRGGWTKLWSIKHEKLFRRNPSRVVFTLYKLFTVAQQILHPPHPSLRGYKYIYVVACWSTCWHFFGCGTEQDVYCEFTWSINNWFIIFSWLLLAASLIPSIASAFSLSVSIVDHRPRK